MIEKSKMIIWIIVGAFILTPIVYSLVFKFPVWALREFEKEFPTFTGPQGSFAGTLTGSMIGLLAVAASAVLGFYFLKKSNQHQVDLQRKEAANRREQDTIALATVLAAELRGLKGAYSTLLKFYVDDPAGMAAMHDDDHIRHLDDIGLPPPSAIIYTANVGKLDLLSHKTIVRVIEAYETAALDAYVTKRERVAPTPASRDFVNNRTKTLRGYIELVRRAIVALRADADAAAKDT